MDGLTDEVGQGFSPGLVDRDGRRLPKVLVAPVVRPFWEPFVGAPNVVLGPGRELFTTAASWAYLAILPYIPVHTTWMWKIKEKIFVNTELNRDLSFFLFKFTSPELALRSIFCPFINIFHATYDFDVGLEMKIKRKLVNYCYCTNILNIEKWWERFCSFPYNTI